MESTSEAEKLDPATADSESSVPAAVAGKRKRDDQNEKDAPSPKKSKTAEHISTSNEGEKSAIETQDDDNGIEQRNARPKNPVQLPQQHSKTVKSKGDALDGEDAPSPKKSKIGPQTSISNDRLKFSAETEPNNNRTEPYHAGPESQIEPPRQHSKAVKRKRSDPDEEDAPAPKKPNTRAQASSNKDMEFAAEPKSDKRKSPRKVSESLSAVTNEKSIDQTEKPKPASSKIPQTSNAGSYQTIDSKSGPSDASQTSNAEPEDLLELSKAQRPRAIVKLKLRVDPPAMYTSGARKAASNKPQARKSDVEKTAKNPVSTNHSMRYIQRE